MKNTLSLDFVEPQHSWHLKIVLEENCNFCQKEIIETDNLNISCCKICFDKKIYPKLGWAWKDLLS